MSELQALIRALIKRELDARETQEPTGTLVGTVVGVPDTSRRMLVTIGGSTRPVPVWRPALPTPPVAGDRVSIARGPEGYLVVTSVLDRDPAIIEVPDIPDGLDLAGLVALGVATQEGLDAHADDETHLHRYVTPNTLAVDDGHWSKIAEGVISEQFGSVAAQLFLNGQGSNGDTWTRGQVRFRIRQQDDFGNDPSVVLELLDFGDIAGDDISLVVLDNAGPTTFELYVRVTREYEWLEWTPMWVRRDRADLRWTGCQPFVSALP